MSTNVASWDAAIAKIFASAAVGRLAEFGQDELLQAVTEQLHRATGRIAALEAELAEMRGRLGTGRQG